MGAEVLSGRNCAGRISSSLSLRTIGSSWMGGGVLEKSLGLRADEVLLLHAVGDCIHGNNFNKMKKYQKFG